MNQIYRERAEDEGESSIPCTKTTGNSQPNNSSLKNNPPHVHRIMTQVTQKGQRGVHPVENPTKLLHDPSILKGKMLTFTELLLFVLHLTGWSFTEMTHTTIHLRVFATNFFQRFFLFGNHCQGNPSCPPKATQE